MKTIILVASAIALLTACEAVEDKCRKLGHSYGNQQRQCVALHEAAKSGDPILQFALAMEYLNKGRAPYPRDAIPVGHLEVIQDNYDEGMSWLAKSADQNFVDAQYKLGREYSREVQRNAKAVPKDPVLAYYYLAISGINGHDNGSGKAAALLPWMTSEQVEEAKSRVERWQRKNE